jgi:hypothetical protein
MFFLMVVTIPTIWEMREKRGEDIRVRKEYRKRRKYPEDKDTKQITPFNFIDLFSLANYPQGNNINVRTFMPFS